MKKFFIPLFIIVVLVIYIIPDSPKASENDLNNREKVIKFLESAFLAQISLSEEDRSKEEIKEILDPFFTEEYQALFLEANLQEQNGKYFTYGTDFGEWYVPFFNFSDWTKVVFEDKEIFVFEYFPENHTGPIGYDAHYEGLLIKNINGHWKISKYLYDQIPEEIILKGIEQME